MANTGMGDTPSDEYIQNKESEKTRICFEFLGWSTLQWDDPLTILERHEELLADNEAESHFSLLIRTPK
jgi:hypothetical protein